jgi:hypothetical protein
VYPVLATCWPERATIRLVKPDGNRTPLASAGCSAPYGLGPFCAGAAIADGVRVLPKAVTPAPMMAARKKFLLSTRSSGCGGWWEHDREYSGQNTRNRREMMNVRATRTGNAHAPVPI